ncbi:prolyl oligopeptidase family serine peptidase [Actinocorallia populi]|uniref:prolyl oligopeptidase family serine peptidase n=1 Tax=Actinocorallia populi TaxID=2079200 RepID=UPI000D093C93|nr:prolyl oligopeptidase family serine peptidase [Actinocorallia populi]
MRVTAYPRAERGDLVEVLHGRPVADPYRWLEDAASAATARWSAEQDALWRAHAAGLPGREALRERALALADAGTVTAPVRRAGREFALRRLPGRPHPVLYADGRAIVDPALLDPGGTTVLDSWDPSPEGTRVAVQLSRDGTEVGDLHVLDAGTGDVLGPPVPGCRHAPVAWICEDAFYYVRDQWMRVRRVGGEDTAVLRVRGVPGLGISHDGNWLVISSAGPGGTGLRLADLRHGSPAAPPSRPVPHALAAAVGRDGRLYLAVPERDGLALAVADPRRPRERRTLLPPDPEAPLADFTVLAETLLVSRLRDGAGELLRHDRESGAYLGSVALPGRGTLGRLSAEGDSAWFTYTDTLTPPQVWRYDGGAEAASLWEDSPARIGLPEVRTHVLTATSPDGTPVRVTVLAPPGAGPRPTILHGYGGFGLPMTPSYAPDSLAWIEAGGALAIAHVRGDAGSRSQGVGAHRMRTLEDFLAAARLLIDDGWTSPDRLGLWGESNGGLLAAAALTRSPELFAAAVCVAPLLDMVRYERSGLGPLWTAEYGSASDPAAFHHLLAYSPYHRVRPGTRYPAVLLASFGGDTRVDPLHARKMCAALQRATSGDGPILLRHESGVGHGDRATGTAAGLAADLLAFLAAGTGLSR